MPAIVLERLTGRPSHRLAAKRRMRPSPSEQGRSLESRAVITAAQSISPRSCGPEAGSTKRRVKSSRRRNAAWLMSSSTPASAGYSPRAAARSAVASAVLVCWRTSGIPDRPTCRTGSGGGYGPSPKPGLLRTQSRRPQPGGASRGSPCRPRCCAFGFARHRPQPATRGGTSSTDPGVRSLGVTKCPPVGAAAVRGPRPPCPPTWIFPRPL
jgi:hypothetical protein